MQTEGETNGSSERTFPFPAMSSASFSSELRTVLRLSAPVVLTQLGLMMTNIIDSLMVGHIGVTELAASALGNLWQWTFMSFGFGLVMGIDPLVSQAHGRGDGNGVALAYQRGVVLALLASIPICLAGVFTREGLLFLGQDPHTAELAREYNLWKLPTVPCFLLYTVQKQYLQGRTIMAPATWVIWLGNIAHVVANYALVFGHFGSPALGLKGAAIAGSTTTILLAVGLFAWTRGFGLFRGADRAWDRESVSPRALLGVTRLGFPVGIQVCLESTAFSGAAVMAGWMGTTAVASHQVTLMLAALAFMVPYGFSQGGATRVGNLVGAGDHAGMRRAATAAVVAGVAAMAVSAVIFVVLRSELPRLFTSDQAVIALAASILPIAAAFQLSDGAQGVAGGILRGLGKPDAAAYVNLVGYYALALPAAYFFGVKGGYGLPGVWIALAGGLTIVAASLLVWVARTVRRPIEELTVQTAG
jgi:MATE family multidrug resistance protein